jgi:hypothetical protein
LEQRYKVDIVGRFLEQRFKVDIVRSILKQYKKDIKKLNEILKTL